MILTVQDYDFTSILITIISGKMLALPNITMPLLGMLCEIPVEDFNSPLERMDPAVWPYGNDDIYLWEIFCRSKETPKISCPIGGSLHAIVVVLSHSPRSSNNSGASGS
jgi:hypothetical protein